MASSKSPSTPSEGEIIESGSETKTTTSKFPLNGTSVDRHTRASSSSASLSSSRSPRRRRSRSRSRSRSPYRDYSRGHKRRRDDEYYDDSRRYYRQEPPPPRPRVGQRYDDGYYDRGHFNRRSRSYYDYDREEGYGGGLSYTDDYDYREEKRPRTRSRSPYRDTYREVRKPRQYSGDEWQSGKGDSSSSRSFRGRGSSSEQLVSERGNIPIVAQASRRDAETRENQVQQAPSGAGSRVVDKYVVPSFMATQITHGVQRA